MEKEGKGKRKEGGGRAMEWERVGEGQIKGREGKEKGGEEQNGLGEGERLKRRGREDEWKEEWGGEGEVGDYEEGKGNGE